MMNAGAVWMISVHAMRCVQIVCLPINGIARTVISLTKTSTKNVVETLHMVVIDQPKIEPIDYINEKVALEKEVERLRALVKQQEE